MSKIAFATLGCKLNYAETSTYRRGFEATGWEVVPWTQPADVYLVNTCAVTAVAEKKSRNLIRRAHSLSPDARILVTGCYAQLRRPELEQMPGVWRVYGADEKHKILNENAIETSVFSAYSTGERTRSFLKVQDGCDNFCAYCTVPFARGRSRSLPICEVVRNAREIAASGVREVVLTGVNTGDYGRGTSESFLDLLKALNEVPGIDRYRISSIEPNLITEEIVDWIASGTKFQPHFHIPLQSGSDTLLKKVGRRYDTALFASRIDYIRSRMGSGVFFGIDVIVGLPGETEELFQETVAFLRDVVKPAFIHVFPYSRRPGTRAAEWTDQVPESVKKERVDALEALCSQLHDEFVRSCKGQKAQVLWESARKDGMMGGYTGNYIRVERPWDASRVNTLEEVVL
ncbi:MAG: tRNA (N(6)-L-threonylcarbamoyladenosine(37)-C(2))-methylthiotransferase MtaB [Bacteroidales bacterium]|nr:tRNA (N(6)-L-threonylcarbamoyladenosine(37)-C(2))-methylthiotransferase MtaB [Bacteroidales bacterium]